MDTNTSKAIEYTITILGAIVVGVLLSFVFDSLWPIGISFVGCTVAGCWLILGNAYREWRCSQLDRQLRKFN